MKLCKHVSLAGDDDGANLLDGKKGTYFQLNATGSLILHRLLSGQSANQVASFLSTEFNIDPEACLIDIENLTTQLKERGLVR